FGDLPRPSSKRGGTFNSNFKVQQFNVQCSRSCQAPYEWSKKTKKHTVSTPFHYRFGAIGRFCATHTKSGAFSSCDLIREEAVLTRIRSKLLIGERRLAFERRDTLEASAYGSKVLTNYTGHKPCYRGRRFVTAPTNPSFWLNYSLTLFATISSVATS